MNGFFVLRLFFALSLSSFCHLTQYTLVQKLAVSAFKSGFQILVYKSVAFTFLLESRTRQLKGMSVSALSYVWFYGKIMFLILFGFWLP